MSKIEIGHGSGGKLTRDLIENIFVKYLSCDELKPLEDSSYISLVQPGNAFTTDSYVVRPLFFPGGNIGKLSVCGTVNDLLVSGAIPRYLSVGFILEEGLSFESLEEVLKSIQQSAISADVKIVTGDTKVVERNKCDGIFINTSGIGDVLTPMSSDNIKNKDTLIITGTIGDHGTAIALAREKFNIDAPVQSDCAALNTLLLPLLDMDGVKWMRDPTRGGVATVLAEISGMTGFGILIHEDRVPVRDDVRFVSDMLGYDPLYLANEGKAVIITYPDAADTVIKKLREHPLGRDANIIGQVTSDFQGVRLKTRIGGERALDMLEEDMLPRIC
jgi:hydrogenase expression/formation protein HypE